MLCMHLNFMHGSRMDLTNTNRKKQKLPSFVLEQEPKEVFDDRLPEPDSWDGLRHAPTLRFGETGEELPDEDLAHDADAEAECEAEAVQQATARHDAEMAKQAEEVANGKPPPLVPEVAVPPAPAPVAAEAVAVPTEPVGPVTSTTHRKQFMALQRVVQGPRASAFPEITKLFGSGTKAERLKVLKTYVQNGENLQAVESAFRASRTHSETMRTTRRLMTISEMQQAGFSECLGCITCT